MCTVVFDRKDCYCDVERDLLAIAKFLVKFGNPCHLWNG